jgi:dTDP-4-amino-4,6-dideoxygalactose transaminase
MQAALGRSQLVRLDAFIARRRALAARYRTALARAPRCRVPSDAGVRHVYHRFVVALDVPLEPVLSHLERRGVTARRPVFRPIHQALGLSGYPNAERLWAQSLSLPCYPSLTDAEADTVVTALLEALA